MLTLVGRVIVVVAGAVWLGGLTFYAAVVIPTAHDVLGSHREVGFITQRVTERINLIAVAALAVFVVQTAAIWRGASRRQRIGLASACLVMAGAQIMLFVLHPILDGMLDQSTHAIRNAARFYTLHRVYLAGTMLQMLAGLWFLTLALATWQSDDGGCNREGMQRGRS